MSWWYSRPYVGVAEKRAMREHEKRRLQKSGLRLSPIQIEGTKIAKSFWGRAWCDNLESYSDYENRLPRGRTYVRGGAVLDLQIQPGLITAMVSGSSLYRIEITVKPVAAAAWRALKCECAGKVHSLMDLLLGRLSQPVMEVMTRPKTGLFPKPAEIDLDCSCPDWADMCKHVAAALYAVGSRLDESPELLFTLRGVDHTELVTEATASATTSADDAAGTLDNAEIAEVFDIEIEQAAPTSKSPTPAKRYPRKLAEPVGPKRPTKKRQRTPTAKLKTAKSTRRSLPTSKPARKRIRKALLRRMNVTS